jgi:hypothetical protein
MNMKNAGSQDRLDRRLKFRKRGGFLALVSHGLSSENRRKYAIGVGLRLVMDFPGDAQSGNHAVAQATIRGNSACRSPAKKLQTRPLSPRLEKNP